MPREVHLVYLIELDVFSIARMHGCLLDGHPRRHDTVIPSKLTASSMEVKVQIDAILCNHAEAVNNLLYISGGGIEIAIVPPVADPPYVVNVGIGIMVTVPWGQTNQQHQVDIELVTEDGQPVHFAAGSETPRPLRGQLVFNVGRPAGIVLGDDQHVCLAANLPGLPMPALGKYEFIVRIDGNAERRLPYRVSAPVGMQMAAGRQAQDQANFRSSNKSHRNAFE